MTHSTHSVTSIRLRTRMIGVIAAFGFAFLSVFALSAPRASAMIAGPNTEYCSYSGNEPINGDCPAEYANCTDGCVHLDPTIILGGGGGGGEPQGSWHSAQRNYVDIEYTVFSWPHSTCNDGFFHTASVLDGRISVEFSNRPTTDYKVRYTCIRDPRYDGRVYSAYRVTSEWTFSYFE